jgi:hypothetical protein
MTSDGSTTSEERAEAPFLVSAMSTDGENPHVLRLHLNRHAGANEVRAYMLALLNAPKTIATLQRSADEMREALESALAWHESEDKALSKSGRSDSQYHWSRLQHREQRVAIEAALSKAKGADQ